MDGNGNSADGELVYAAWLSNNRRLTATCIELFGYQGGHAYVTVAELINAAEEARGRPAPYAGFLLQRPVKH